MANELFVTLKKSDNRHLIYPCKGWLQLFELGVDGSVISGVWRGLQADGSAACPVEVRRVEFEYAGGQFKVNKPLNVEEQFSITAVDLDHHMRYIGRTGGFNNPDGSPRVPTPAEVVNQGWEPASYLDQFKAISK